jgi:hypothetical protein
VDRIAQQAEEHVEASGRPPCKYFDWRKEEQGNLQPKMTDWVHNDLNCCRDVVVGKRYVVECPLHPQVSHLQKRKIDHLLDGSNQN